MSLRNAVTWLNAGQSVFVRPHGNSMTPRIRSGDLVHLTPCDGESALVGDVVLCRLRGRLLLHIITAKDPARRRAQISNNHGHVNGWVAYEMIFGKADS